MKYGRQSNVVVVLDPLNHVLVLRRGPTDPYAPGSWNFPGGHREDSDATAQAGAARELYEEAGIKVDPNQLNWAFSYREGVTSVTNVLWVRLKTRPKVRYIDGEHDDYRWVPLDRLPSPGIPGMWYIQQQLGAGTNLTSTKSISAKKNGYVTQYVLSRLTSSDVLPYTIGAGLLVVGLMGFFGYTAVKAIKRKRG